MPDYTNTKEYWSKTYWGGAYWGGLLTKTETPPCRILAIHSENRFLDIHSEDRFLVIHKCRDGGVQ